jgi:hypothetical protein
MKIQNEHLTRLFKSVTRNRFTKLAATLGSLAVVAVLAVGAASPGPSEALVTPFQTMNIRFVGFTDGVHFVINNTNGVVTGSYTGSDTSPIVGVKTRIPKQKNAAAIVFRSQYDRIHVVRLDRKKTWVYYNPNGTVYNSGTWSNAPAIAIADDGKQPALPSSNSPH